MPLPQQLQTSQIDYLKVRSLPACRRVSMFWIDVSSNILRPIPLDSWTSPHHFFGCFSDVLLTFWMCFFYTHSGGFSLQEVHWIGLFFFFFGWTYPNWKDLGPVSLCTGNTFIDVSVVSWCLVLL